MTLTRNPDPKSEPEEGSAEFDEVMMAFFAANDRMKADAVLCDEEALQGIETATWQDRFDTMLSAISRSSSATEVEFVIEKVAVLPTLAIS